MPAAYQETLGGNIRRFVGDTFGFRGSKNLTSWLVAGGLAYYFIYLPEYRRSREAQVSGEGLAQQHSLQQG
jgi:hypothetical protein